MCIATMRSMTQAIKAREQMFAARIDTEIVSIDPALTKRGCAYGLAFPGRGCAEVRQILAQKRIGCGVLLGEERI